MAKETDEQLVQRMATRDESALIELHNRYAHRLVTFIGRILEDPDDVMQSALDTFANAWNHAETFDPEKMSAKAWLVTMCHRLALNRRRGTELELEPSQRWDAPARQPDQGEEDEVEVVTSLGKRGRDYLELAFYRGYSQGQVAEETGVPLSTVRAEMHQALQRLRAGQTGGNQ